jgi:hypothetical protein
MDPMLLALLAVGGFLAYKTINPSEPSKAATPAAGAPVSTTGATAAKTAAPTSLFTLVDKIGPLIGANDYDMLITVAKSSDGKYYLLPLTWSASDSTATFERTLAAVAISKFKAQLAKTGVDIATLLPSSTILDMPAGLADGTKFKINFANPLTFVPGMVVGIVTAEQMRLGVAGESSNQHTRWGLGQSTSVGYTWGSKTRQFGGKAQKRRMWSSGY